MSGIMNSGESRSERGGQSMTTNSGYSYPDTSKSPDAPMSYKEHSNGANASFVPFAKDFDTDKSLGPPYPRTLHAQSSDEKAFNKDKLSQPCQVHGYELSRCCQGRCSDEDPGHAEHISRQRSIPTATGPYYAGMAASNQTDARPWGPSQSQKVPNEIPPRRSDTGFSPCLQDWQQQPANQGPYHGIASVPQANETPEYEKYSSSNARRRA